MYLYMYMYLHNILYVHCQLNSDTLLAFISFINSCLPNNYTSRIYITAKNKWLPRCRVFANMYIYY